MEDNGNSLWTMRIAKITCGAFGIGLKLCTTMKKWWARWYKGHKTEQKWNSRPITDTHWMNPFGGLGQQIAHPYTIVISLRHNPLHALLSHKMDTSKVLRRQVPEALRLPQISSPRGYYKARLLVSRISAVFYHLEIWPPNVSCTNPHFMTPLLYRVKVIKQGLVKRSQRWRQLKHWKLPKNTVLPPICQSRGSLTLSFNWFSKRKKNMIP